MIFAHDAKVRAMCYAASLHLLPYWFGAEGEALVQADAGPLDIADRGSAQNAAASTNFDDGERDASAVDMQALIDGGTQMPYSGQ